MTVAGHLWRRTAIRIGHLIAGHLLTALPAAPPTTLSARHLLATPLILLSLGELLQDQIRLLLGELACGYILIQFRFQGFHTRFNPCIVKGFEGILEVYLFPCFLSGSTCGDLGLRLLRGSIGGSLSIMAPMSRPVTKI